MNQFLCSQCKINYGALKTDMREQAIKRSGKCPECGRPFRLVSREFLVTKNMLKDYREV